MFDKLTLCTSLRSKYGSKAYFKAVSCLSKYLVLWKCIDHLISDAGKSYHCQYLIKMNNSTAFIFIINIGMDYSS